MRVNELGGNMKKMVNVTRMGGPRSDYNTWLDQTRGTDKRRNERRSKKVTNLNRRLSPAINV